MSDVIIKGCGWKFNTGYRSRYLIVKPTVLVRFEEESFDIVRGKEE
jgi:hypothetical protein